MFALLILLLLSPTKGWVTEADTRLKRQEDATTHVRSAAMQMLSKKLDRLEEKFEKILDAMETPEMQGDYAKEQMVAKLNILDGRMQNKILDLSNKMEVESLKIQTTLLSTLGKFERLEYLLNSRQRNFDGAISHLLNNGDEFRQRIDVLEETIFSIRKDISDFKMCKGPTFENERNGLTRRDTEDSTLLKMIKKEIEDTISNYGSKVAEMQSDLWEKMRSIEYIALETNVLVNFSREEIRSTQKFLKQTRKGSYPLSLANESRGNVTRELMELNMKLENGFQTLALHLESCGRWRKDEEEEEDQEPEKSSRGQENVVVFEQMQEELRDVEAETKPFSDVASQPTASSTEPGQISMHKSQDETDIIVSEEN